jgi:hypothetical protein
MDCEKYSPDGISRGPYEIAYCENAIAAWSDSPLQMVIIPQPVTVTTPDPAARIAVPNGRPE